MTRPLTSPRFLTADLSGVADLLRDLALPDDAADLLLFIDLCRRSLRVRAWLFGRFASEPATQAAFRAYLADPQAPGPDRPLWPRVLAAALRPNPPAIQPGQGPHGGLWEIEVLALIKGYQAGLLDVSTFALVRLWRRFVASDRIEVPLALQFATARHFGRLANDDSGRLARELQQVLRFFRQRTSRPLGATDFGHADSWKIHLLLHVLDHPRPAYKVSELRESLPERYRRVDRHEIRLFCQQHGLRRDERPGRPSSRNGRSPTSANSPLRPAS